jgi:hypothetical protein
MRSITALIIALMLLSGCATASSNWETAAVGAALADIASTGGALSKEGFREANPVYGSQPSAGKMLALNAGVYAGVWALTREINPVERQKVWRAVTILRLLVTGWNLSQNGFSLSFRF